jgi:hypothetical protein
MPNPNPLAPLSKLRDRVAAAVKARGLILQQFVVIPGGDPNGPHRAQIVLVPDDDWKPGEAPIVSDPEFERVMREAELAEEEARAAEVRDGLTTLRDDLMDPRGGIGLDD